MSWIYILCVLAASVIAEEYFERGKIYSRSFIFRHAFASCFDINFAKHMILYLHSDGPSAGFSVYHKSLKYCAVFCIRCLEPTAYNFRKIP